MFNKTVICNLTRTFAASVGALSVLLQPVLSSSALAQSQECHAVAADVNSRGNQGEFRRQISFGMKLLLSVAGAGDRNVAVSPFGVESVLGELGIGADARMKAAILKTLQFNADDDVALEKLHKNSRLLRRVSGDALTLADGLFVNTALDLKPGIRETLEADGGVLVKSVNFGSDENVAEINKWVSDTTGGRITSILEPDASLALAAVNALHFKDCWLTPFDAAKTREMPFAMVAGKQAPRLTMVADFDDLRHVRRGRFDAVELPYTDQRFLLTAVTTNDAPAAPSAFAKAVFLLSEPSMKAGTVRVAMPRFSASSETDLLTPLSKLGLSRGLDSPKALAKLADGLSLNMIRQKTFVAVNEQGTEAAAATVAGASRSVEVNRPARTISFDKPFVYVLRHRTSGAILMMGYVADPQV